MEKNREPINLHICAQMIFNKGAKTISMGKEQFLQQIVLGKLDSHMQKLDPYLLPYKKLTHRASLVAQWLRICLPMQRTRV